MKPISTTRPAEPMHPAVAEAYERTRTYLSTLDQAAGVKTFRIFASPVREDAPVWLVGWQPGGSDDRHRTGEHDGPPERSDLVTRHYRYAVTAVGLFAQAGVLNKIEEVVLADAVFFRTPTMRAWNDVDKDLRANLEEFCLKELALLVKILRPKIILAVGAKTALRLAGSTNQLPKNANFAGIPLLPLPHLSSSWVGETEFATAVEMIRKAFVVTLPVGEMEEV